MVQYPQNSDELETVHAGVTWCEYEVHIAIAGEVGDAKLRRIQTQVCHLRSKKQTVDAALNDPWGCSGPGLQAGRTPRASHREVPPLRLLCPHIEDGDPALQDLITSDSYRARLEAPDFPEAANSHLCWSLINESQGELAAAGFACIGAAWVCDDASLDAVARVCRLKAVALFQKARESGQAFTEQTGAEEALLADLLRRSGNADLALDFCEAGLKRGPDRIVSAVLRFEKTLIARCDTAHHTLEEAIANIDGRG